MSKSGCSKNVANLPCGSIVAVDSTTHIAQPVSVLQTTPDASLSIVGQVATIGASPGSTYTFSDSGTGDSLVDTSSTATSFVVKDLIAGSNVTLTSTSTDITINSTASGGTGTLTNVGTVPATGNLIPSSPQTGPPFTVKGLIAGSNVTLASTATDITINSTASGGTGTVTSFSCVANNGITESVATATTTPQLTLGLGAITPTSVNASGTVAGSNLSGTNTGDQTLSNGGAGTSLVAVGSGSTLETVSLTAGTNVTFTTGSNNITINSSGSSANSFTLVSKQAGDPLNSEGAGTFVLGSWVMSASYLQTNGQYLHVIADMTVPAGTVLSYSGIISGNFIGPYTAVGVNIRFKLWITRISATEMFSISEVWDSGVSSVQVNNSGRNAYTFGTGGTCQLLSTVSSGTADLYDITLYQAL
jgi:hypothetical protein